MFIIKSKLTNYCFRIHVPLCVQSFNVPACTKPANDKRTWLDIKSRSGFKRGFAKRRRGGEEAIKLEATMWLRNVLGGKKC